MKGVVLAGGYGTRFYPVTRVVNKHLLDVFDEPVVYYPIRSLVGAGIEEVVLVTILEEVDQFKKLLGDGTELGVKISYATQEGAGGIAQALLMAKPFVENENLMVVLGDNIFQGDLSEYVESFEKQGKGAKILLKQVSHDDARRFGVADVKDGKIIGIQEKPSHPRSDLIVTGCYMYDSRVFDLIATLDPSPRGELEVTDLNNLYIDEGTMSYDVLSGWWTDAGTPASKLKASILVALEKGVTFHR
ncbi:MAG: NTP transferase domain-containing protein [Actinobacteria bacterium]|nr:NTP transferase domain-containing protein [Actinomycetota bacterium]